MTDEQAFVRQVASPLALDEVGRAQAVRDARDRYPDSSLADLYDPLTMPPDLTRAHQALDRAVDRLYRKKAFASDKERLELFLERYRALVERAH